MYVYIYIYVYIEREMYIYIYTHTHAIHMLEHNIDKVDVPSVLSATLHCAPVPDPPRTWVEPWMNAWMHEWSEGGGFQGLGANGVVLFPEYHSGNVFLLAVCSGIYFAFRNIYWNPPHIRHPHPPTSQMNVSVYVYWNTGFYALLCFALLCFAWLCFPPSLLGPPPPSQPFPPLPLPAYFWCIISHQMEPNMRWWAHAPTSRYPWRDPWYVFVCSVCKRYVHCDRNRVWWTYPWVHVFFKVHLLPTNHVVSHLWWPWLVQLYLPIKPVPNIVRNE